MSENKFQIKISSCGSNQCNGGYDIIKDKDALSLGRTVVQIIASDFARDSEAQYKFYLACQILESIKGWKIEDLKSDIEKSKTYKLIMNGPKPKEEAKKDEDTKEPVNIDKLHQKVQEWKRN